MQQIVNSTINKSIQLIKNSQIDEAEALLKQQLLKNPSQIQALNILGQIYLNKQDYSSAITHLEKSIRLNPKDAMANYHLGLAYQKNDRNPEALKCFLTSYELKKNWPEIYKSIGLAYAKDHEYFRAYEFYKKAYRDFKDDFEVLSNLFYICKRLSMHKETLDFCRKAYKKDPNNSILLMSLIFNSHKDPDLSLADFKLLAEEYYKKFLTREHLNIDFSKQKDPTKKKLKIGFVSADLFEHPVSTFLLAVIEQFDKEEFDIYLYYTNEKYDWVTAKFQELCSNFKNIRDIDDKSAAELIANDQIDVLFDLSGYTRGHRLGVFAYKPSPIQITYIGYFGTLGMPEMDYILADDNVFKPEEQQYYTEKVYSLGPCFTHSKLNNVTQLSKEAPCIKNGYITFGSTNRFHKVSEKNIETWSKILSRVPESKLLITCATFARESNREYVLGLFSKYGINSERIILRHDLPRKDFLKTYIDIDILLDSFPYGGGTTSLESLINGVPVITMYGDRWVSRMTSTKLIAIGCTELIANNIEDYINKAVDLAKDKDQIVKYRETLNEKVADSDLDIKKYIERFSKAIKDIWQKECNKS